MRKEKVAGAEAASNVRVDEEEGSFGVIIESKERNKILFNVVWFEKKEKGMNEGNQGVWYQSVWIGIKD